MFLRSKKICVWLAGASLLSGLALGVGGCAPTQATHHSGQIGRFYGGGISFSVPLVKRAQSPGGEDTFWEVRQGIGKALVVVYAPTQKKLDSLRENITVSEEKLAQPNITAEEFRAQQLALLAQDASVSIERPVLGEDAAGPWVQLTGKDEAGRIIDRKAWFFVHPTVGDPASTTGVVMLGTAEHDEDVDQLLESFFRIAMTVKNGRPSSGFAELFTQLDSIVNDYVTTPAVQETAPAATPKKNGTEKK